MAHLRNFIFQPAASLASISRAVDCRGLSPKWATNLQHTPPLVVSKSALWAMTGVTAITLAATFVD
jgi:hypothetical protein